MDYENKSKEVIRNLKCKFSEEHQNKFGHDLAKEESSMRDLEERKKDANKTFAEEAREISKKISILTDNLNFGYEMKDVACKETINFVSGTMTCVREDTMQTVETRPLTEEEKQLSL